MTLSLSEALRTNRLEDFIRQEEKRGVGSADSEELDEALRRVIRQPRSGDRTSRSPSGGGSTGT